jgi:phospholipid-binding lipoprotein MlaA
MKQLEIIGVRVYQTVNHLSLDKDTYESIKKEALDPYLFVRNAYMQNRAARIDK